MAAAADAAFVLPIVDDKDMSTWKGVGGSGGAVAAEDGLLFFFRNDNDDAFDVMVKQRKHKQVVVVCGLGACQFEVVPFPGNGRQGEFRSAMTAIMPSLLSQ